MASASASPIPTTTAEKDAKVDKLPELQVDSGKKISAKPIKNGEPSSSGKNKSVSSLLSALRIFGMSGKSNTKKANEHNEDPSDNDSGKTEPPNALRVLGTVAAVPSLLADKVKSTRAQQLEAGELINLAFLTDEERSTIQKVIQADLRLRRTILGSLRKNIDAAEQTQEQSQDEEKTGQGKPGLSCGVCGQGVTTVCTRVFAEKCLDCGRVVCKSCAGKQSHELSTVCVSCKKRRILKLQTLDYKSILYYGIQHDNEGSDDVPLYSESELIKKSLQATLKSQRSVDYAPSNGTLPRDKQLTQPGPDQERPSSVAALRVSESPVMKTQRSKSDVLPKDGTKTLTIPRISDAGCGFQLMAQASDESLVDLSSVYSEQCYFGVAITGRILIGLWYKAQEKRLYIRIVKAEKLAEAADGTMDPYVKTYLLPGVYKSHKRKTGLQYDTTKPVWNEILKYADLTQEEVQSRTLWASVWDWNRYGRQQFLGEIRIPLKSRDLTNSKDEWFQLKDSEMKPCIETLTDEVDSPEVQVKPRVLVALKFNPYTPDELAKLRSDKKGRLGCLQIMMRRAENLPAMDVNDRTDSFVRAFLLPFRQIGGKKKSKIVENSLNPIWEEEMLYTYVSLEELEAERTLEVTLWDFDRRGTNQFIGGIRIGPNPFDIIQGSEWMDSMESESDHWEEMLDKPGEWVEAWHTLRPSMDSLLTLKEKMKIREASFSSGSLPLETHEKDGRDTPTISSPVPPSSDSPLDQNLRVNISRSGKGHYKISGEILTGIKYKDGSLYVKIMKAAGLTAVHRNGTSNPYIKVYLLPDRSKESKKKTEVKKKTLDPVYNQAFRYKVSEDEIQMRTLWVTVWNHDSIGANLFMGETCISLAGDLRHSIERWYELHDFAESGMVVMATPFGRTPQKLQELRPEEHSLKLSSLKLSSRSDQFQEDKEDATPDTPPQQTADIPEVTVEDAD